jgi:hypothetical protein
MESAVVIGVKIRRPQYWFAAFILMAVAVASLIAVATAVA